MAMVSPSFANARKHKLSASVPELVTIISVGSMVPQSAARRTICRTKPGSFKLKNPGLLKTLCCIRATEPTTLCKRLVGIKSSGSQAEAN